MDDGEKAKKTMVTKMIERGNERKEGSEIYRHTTKDFKKETNKKQTNEVCMA